MGHWDQHKALSIRWGRGGNWWANADLPAGGVFFYKYAVRGVDGNYRWQEGANNLLVLPGEWDIPKDSLFIVDDAFSGLSRSSQNMLASKVISYEKEIVQLRMETVKAKEMTKASLQRAAHHQGGAGGGEPQARAVREQRAEGDRLHAGQRRRGAPHEVIERFRFVFTFLGGVSVRRRQRRRTSAVRDRDEGLRARFDFYGLILLERASLKNSSTTSLQTPVRTKVAASFVVHLRVALRWTSPIEEVHEGVVLFGSLLVPEVHGSEHHVRLAAGHHEPLVGRLPLSSLLSA